MALCMYVCMCIYTQNNKQQKHVTSSMASFWQLCSKYIFKKNEKNMLLCIRSTKTIALIRSMHIVFRFPFSLIKCKFEFHQLTNLFPEICKFRISKKSNIQIIYELWSHNKWNKVCLSVSVLQLNRFILKIKFYFWGTQKWRSSCCFCYRAPLKYYVFIRKLLVSTADSSFEHQQQQQLWQQRGKMMIVLTHFFLILDSYTTTKK